MVHIKMNRCNGGFTLIEISMALALFSILVFAGAEILPAIVRTHSAISDSVVELQDRGFFLRGLQRDIGAAQVMRSGLIQCGTAHALARGEMADTRTLQADGDQFAFVTSVSRGFGVTSDEENNAVRVMDTADYFPGAILWIKGLQGSAGEGLFEVDSIDLGRNLLRLRTSVNAMDAGWSCRPTGVVTLAMRLDRPVKVAIERLRFTQFAFRTSTVDPTAFRLDMWQGPTAERSLSEKLPANGHLLADRAIAWIIQQQFVSTGENTGEYVFQSRLDYRKESARGQNGNLAQTAATNVQGGYRLIGIDVLNEMALPEPPVLSRLFPTCMVNARPVSNVYVLGKTGEPVLIQEVDAYYSDADKLSGLQAPAIPLAFTVNDPRAYIEPRCWTSYRLDSDGFRVLDGDGEPASSAILKPARLSSDGLRRMVEPVYCRVPNQTTINGRMQFSEFSSGSVYNHDIDCTPGQATSG